MKRPWFQISLVTILLMTPVASVLISVNIRVFQNSKYVLSDLQDEGKIARYKMARIEEMIVVGVPSIIVFFGFLVGTEILVRWWRWEIQRPKYAEPHQSKTAKSDTDSPNQS